GCRDVSGRAESEVGGVAIPVYGTIQIDPSSSHFQVCLAHTPRAAHRARKASPALLELRRIPLYPSHDRSMRKTQPTFVHHLNQIAKAELVTQVPAYTQDDHIPVEMSPCKQVLHAFHLRPISSKSPMYPTHPLYLHQSRREILEEDILYIRALIVRYPKESRRKLSARVCEAWQWRQSNGALRDMVCRGMLLMLERAGQIALPPVSYVRHNPLAHRARPEPVLIDKTAIEDPLRKLQPIKFEPVRRTAQEPLFNSLMEEHHYLGYEQPVGEHLKYLVWAEGRPIACLAWSSAPRHLGSRDRYIGWEAAARRSRIRFIAYNTRFLILPWVRVEHPASHILG